MSEVKKGRLLLELPYTIGDAIKYRFINHVRVGEIEAIHIDKGLSISYVTNDGDHLIEPSDVLCRLVKEGEEEPQ